MANIGRGKSVITTTSGGGGSSYTPANQSIKVNGIEFSDDYFVTVDFVNGVAPQSLVGSPAAETAVFHWYNTIPGIAVNATFNWEILAPGGGVWT